MSSAPVDAALDAFNVRLLTIGYWGVEEKVDGLRLDA
jgi:hypothetical protein